MFTVLDVSRWQGRIDWDTVKASGRVHGVMLRALGSRSGTPYIDPMFETNYSACTRLGIPVGVYYYSCAVTAPQRDAELALLHDALRGKLLQLPAAIDVEDARLRALTPDALSALVAGAARQLEHWGLYAMVYTYTHFADTALHMDTLAPFDLWLADYRANPDQTIQRDMHQYTSSGAVAGIGGRVDCNRAYVDFPTLVRAAGKNGFEKEDNTMYSDTLKIGPVSGGDRKTMAALAESLGLPHFDAGDYIIVGPASEGDRKQIVAKAQSLGLGVENYLPPEPEVPEEPETPEPPDVPDMEFDEVMFMLVKLDSKLDRVLEKLELVQQALEDPAAQQVLDKLEKAGAALAK